jgi:hypothetical protein
VFDNNVANSSFIENNSVCSAHNYIQNDFPDFNPVPSVQYSVPSNSSAIALNKKHQQDLIDYQASLGKETAGSRASGVSKVSKVSKMSTVSKISKNRIKNGSENVVKIAGSGARTATKKINRNKTKIMKIFGQNGDSSSNPPRSVNSVSHSSNSDLQHTLSTRNNPNSAHNVGILRESGKFREKHTSIGELNFSVKGEEDRFDSGVNSFERAASFNSLPQKNLQISISHHNSHHNSHHSSLPPQSQYVSPTHHPFKQQMPLEEFKFFFKQNNSQTLLPQTPHRQQQDSPALQPINLPMNFPSAMPSAMPSATIIPPHHTPNLVSNYHNQSLQNATLSNVFSPHTKGRRPSRQDMSAVTLTPQLSSSRIDLPAPTLILNGLTAKGTTKHRVSYRGKGPNWVEEKHVKDVSHCEDLSCYYSSYCSNNDPEIAYVRSLWIDSENKFHRNRVPKCGKVDHEICTCILLDSTPGSYNSDSNGAIAPSSTSVEGTTLAYSQLINENDLLPHQYLSNFSDFIDFYNFRALFDKIPLEKEQHLGIWHEKIAEAMSTQTHTRPSTSPTGVSNSNDIFYLKPFICGQFCGVKVHYEPPLSTPSNPLTKPLRTQCDADLTSIIDFNRLRADLVLYNPDLDQSNKSDQDSKKSKVNPGLSGSKSRITSSSKSATQVFRYKPQLESLDYHVYGNKTPQFRRKTPHKK